MEHKLAFMGGPIGVNKKEYLKKTGGLPEYALAHGTAVASTSSTRYFRPRRWAAR
jgi:hypothetical protein